MTTHMKNKFLCLPVLCLVFVLSSAISICAKVYTITDTDFLSGYDAEIWDTFENEDIVDVSQTEKIGAMYVPKDVSSIAIVGSAGKTYANFSVVCENETYIKIENINAASNSGAAFFEFGEDIQCTIELCGENSFKSTDNSKCIVGNVKICGDGDLVLQSGKSIYNSNLTHCIIGNVIFDTSGTVSVISGNGKDGTAKSVDGISAGDAIKGNVECKNSGTVNITAGDGGYVYILSESGGKGGNGGNGIRGNLLCSGKTVVNINGGMGNYYGSRLGSSTVGTPGDGVCGNVILKGEANVVICGGDNRKNDSHSGCGVHGNVKLYDKSVLKAYGGDGLYGALSRGGNGGDGIFGSIELFDEANAEIFGGNASNGDSGNSSYPTSYGDGGVGGCGIEGDVYLCGEAVLSASGGDGGDGGNFYTTSTKPTSGTSMGGNGAPAVLGDVTIEENAVLSASGGSGGDGGKAKTSKGGNGGDAVIGSFAMSEKAKVVALGGSGGETHYAASTYSSGKDGCDIVLTNSLILSGGYVDALFYDEDGKIVQPLDNDGNMLYKTVIKIQNKEELYEKEVFEVVSDGEVYANVVCEDDWICCYLPSGKSLFVRCGEYSAQIPCVWEDNSTKIFMTMEKCEYKDEKLQVECSIVAGHIVFFVKSSGSLCDKMLHIALYGKDDILLDYIIVPTKDAEKYINVVFAYNTEAEYAKVFLWNTKEAIEPVLKAETVELKSDVK